MKAAPGSPRVVSGMGCAIITPMTAVVEQYLAALDAQDWPGVAATLTDHGFERIGPYRDVVASKGAYVRFLERVVSTLGEYRLVPERVVSTERVIYAEVTESCVHAGEKMAFPEVLVFDLADDGLIGRVQVYMMRPGEEPTLEKTSGS
jgi:SnoaL-like domain